MCKQVDGISASIPKSMASTTEASSDVLPCYCQSGTAPPARRPWLHTHTGNPFSKCVMVRNMCPCSRLVVATSADPDIIAWYHPPLTVRHAADDDGGRLATRRPPGRCPSLRRARGRPSPKTSPENPTGNCRLCSKTATAPATRPTSTALGPILCTTPGRTRYAICEVRSGVTLGPTIPVSSIQ
ncbi:hypothetical protein BV20DRAFT_646255 [Pilatotrama ljubarskyi]|nr:hypothetical protein BV20DRAFT_646255 [Pilatotrama ljubarskyi]